MARRLRSVYDLQGIDLEIDEVGRALQEVERRLGDNEGLRQAKEAFAQAEASLASLQRQLRSQELDVEAVLAKRENSEKALYGGEVRNPKELASLQQEMEILKKHQQQAEDLALEAMAQVEALEGEVKARGEKLRALEGEWAEVEVELRREEEGLRTRLGDLHRKKAALEATVEPEDLAIYQDLRRRKGGLAVSLVEGGICRGCGVTLPTSTTQEIIRAQELVHCANCERILYIKG